MGLTMLETSAVLDVPPAVAVCPYCGKALSVQFSGWEQQDDGLWVANCLEIDCESQPEIGESDEWDYWLAQHTYMPYVYWLPVHQKVERWVNANYRFNVKD